MFGGMDLPSDQHQESGCVSEHSDHSGGEQARLCNVRLNAIPPLQIPMKMFLDADVNKVFVNAMFQDGFYMDNPENDNQPTTLFHNDSRLSALADQGTEFENTFLNEIQELSRFELQQFVMELFGVTCAGLYFRKETKKDDKNFYVPRSNVQDLLVALQVVFCRFMGDVRSPPSVNETFLEWQRNLPSKCDFWEEARVKDFDVWEAERGYADCTTQTENAIVEDEVVQHFNVDEEEKSDEKQQPQPNKQETPIKTESKQFATATTSDQVESKNSNEVQESNEKRINPRALDSVIRSPEAAETTSKPDFVFCRVRNACEVSGVKLVQRWDSIMCEMFTDTSCPSVFASDNIREIRSIGQTGVSIYFYETPSTTEIEMMTRICVSQKGQEVLRRVFETNSTIGAAKFVPNHSPDSSPKRWVGNTWFDSPKDRKLKTSRRRHFLRRVSPIRQPNFLLKDDFSPPHNRGEHARLKYSRPQRHFNVMQAPQNMQLNMLQQQIQSMSLIQQQMLSALQGMGAQFFT